MEGIEDEGLYNLGLGIIKMEVFGKLVIELSERVRELQYWR